jgi:hypothetical protein
MRYHLVIVRRRKGRFWQFPGAGGSESEKGGEPERGLGWLEEERRR